MARAQAIRGNDRVPVATNLRGWLEACKGDQTGGETVGADVRYCHNVARFQRWNRRIARDVVQSIIRRTHHVDGLKKFTVRPSQRLDRGNRAINPAEARQSTQMNHSGIEDDVSLAAERDFHVEHCREESPARSDEITPRLEPKLCVGS